MLEVSPSTRTPRTRRAKARVAEIAERQWGLITRAQLEQSGLEAAGIARWIKDGGLQRVHPHVYTVGHGCLTLQGRLAAALFYAGPRAALCGVTAGSWLGMLKATPRHLHVITPRKCRSLKRVRVYDQRRFKRIFHKRLPVTPPGQTLLDIARVLERDQLRRALAEAEYLKLVTLDEVEATLGPGRPGSAALRAALDCHRPQLARTKSQLEQEFVLLCERHSLTPPGVNVWVHGWLVDAVWFEQKVVVELDGYAAHGIPAAMEKDRRRDLELRAAGFTVLRYTWHQITNEPEPVIADLRRLIPSRRGPAPRS